MFVCALSVFFFTDTATTEIYTLSLHDALPICRASSATFNPRCVRRVCRVGLWSGSRQDRKSTRLNSSHVSISYAVFCLKKKNELDQNPQRPAQHHVEDVTAVG